MPAGLDVPPSVVHSARYVVPVWLSVSGLPGRPCTAVVAEAGLAVAPHDTHVAGLLLPWHAVVGVTTQLEAGAASPGPPSNQAGHLGAQGLASSRVAVCVSARADSACTWRLFRDVARSPSLLGTVGLTPYPLSALLSSFLTLQIPMCD